MKKINLACIIDDDEIFVFATKKMMEFIRFCDAFLVFHNGEEAINYLRPVILANENIPEIILLDLNMPVMDGWQFLEEFIQIPSKKEILIYVVTSSNNLADIERVNKYQRVNNYIVKPISPQVLQTILETYDRG